MRSILAAILAALTLCALSACGAQEQPETPAPAEPAPVQEPEEIPPAPTAEELAAQGVYVNTPRIKRNPSAPPVGLFPIRTRISAALCREAGRLVSRHPAGEESGSGKPPGRKPHMVPLRWRST